MRRSVLIAVAVAVVAAVNVVEIGADGPALAATALCLPTTAVALLILGLLAPGGRVSLLIAFAWGAVVVGLPASSINGALGDWSLRTFDPGLPLTWFGAGGTALTEELLKLGVVGIIVLESPPAGLAGWGRTIIFGAASGVGFNFGESSTDLATDISNGDALGGLGDWLTRQVVDLLAGHATDTALAAAGIGAAIVIASTPAARIALAWCGVAAGTAAHFVWDGWGAGLPAPDGLAGVFVSAAEALLVDGVSFLCAAGIVLLILRALPATGRRPWQLVAPAAPPPPPIAPFGPSA